MSYVKNVQAFGKLMGICTGYGGQYNPGQQNLQVEALITLLNNAQNSLSEVNEAQTLYDNVTNTRELGFKGVRKLSSRVMSVLKSCGAHELTIADARVSLRKLWGTRSLRSQVAAKASASEEPAKPAFVYALDYASLAFYFSKLVETVSAEPLYQPTEPELSVGGLEEKVAELYALNQAVMQAEIALTTARRKRNAIFYKSEGNLVATAVAAKNYVRGAFGFSSAQRAEVSRIRFNKPTE